MKTFRILKPTAVLFLAAVLMQSCKEDEPQDTLPFSRFPLEVGRKWTYLNTNPNVYFLPDTIISNWEVVRTEMLNGKLNYVIRRYTTESNSNTIMSESYFFQDNTGLYYTAERGQGIWTNFKKEQSISFPSLGAEFFHAPNDTFFLDSLLIFDPPQLRLKYPVSLGDEWIGFISPYSSDTLISRYEDTAAVSTPLGTFHTISISLNFTQPTNFPESFTSFFSNEGLIRYGHKLILTNQNGEVVGPYEIVFDLVSMN